MSTISLVGLVKIELPSATLRFADGGYFDYNSERYRDEDATYGSIAALETMEETVGDLVPALNLILLPKDVTAAIALSTPGNQTAAVNFYIAEYDVDSGLVTTVDTFFSGFVDQTILSVSKETYEISMEIVSLAERLFEGNIGNSLNPTFHKSVWSGELGHDNATGLTIPIAWGVESPARSSGGSGGGGSRDAFDPFQEQAR